MKKQLPASSPLADGGLAPATFVAAAVPTAAIAVSPPVQAATAPLRRLPTLPLPTLPLSTLTSEQPFPPSSPSILLPPVAQWQWGLSATTAFDWAQPRPGFELGVFGARKLGQKTQLLANISYVARRESFHLPANGAALDNNSTTPTADSLTASEIYIRSVAQAQLNQTNHIRSRRLRLGLGINQSIGSLWELGLQAGAAYLVGGQVPRFFSLPSSDFSLNSGSLENINTNQLASEFDNFNRACESIEAIASNSGFFASAAAANYRRWDFDLQGRLAYRLNPQLALFGVAQYSFQPLLRSEYIQFRAGRGQLGLRWTFL